MKYEYDPKGVCSSKFIFDIENDVITSARVIGGCNGNLQGICRLITGRTIQEVINTLSGIRCGFKPTSCPDQISMALKEYAQNE